MKISKESVTYSFHPKLTPVASAKSGELITFETIDALGGQIQSEQDTLNDLDFSKVNPATGPLFIEGAEVGDGLKVDIIEIDTDPQGVMLAVPGLGVLGEQVTKPETKVVAIGKYTVDFGEIRLPKTPMIGVIGVATAKEDVPCGTPGDHGGNMDTKEICPGNNLYLPVFQPGAMLALGDVHAVMGDGEICGTGVECGARVVVRVSLLKGMGLERPLLETPTEIQAIASAKTADEAAKMAVADMVALLQKNNGLSFNQAYMLTSIAGNVRISQLVDPLITVRVGISKSILAG